jgi:hypothetical protein
MLRGLPKIIALGLSALSIQGTGSCDKIRVMKDEPSLRKTQKVSCPCGSDVSVNPLSPDRRVTCPGCRNTFDFVVTMDADRRTSRLSLVLTREVLHTEGESLGAATEEPAPRAKPAPPPPKAAPVSKNPTRVSKKAASKASSSASTASCECGGSFPIEDTGELATLQSCPDCNRTYHVVFKIEPGTKKKVPIVVPGKPIVHRRTVPPSSKPASAADPVADIFTERRNRTKVGKKPARAPAGKVKPPPEIPPGAQGVPCPCGNIFVVRRRDIGNEMTCEACGKAAVFEEARDYQTLAPIIRIRNH